MARNILNSYIPKVFVELNRNNEDIITVSTNYLSPDGDSYVLDRETVSPILVQTTQSLAELQPEISNVYPFVTVTPLDFDGATIILSPSVDTEPTASQGYYVPIYFERYNPDIVNLIDTTFVELISGSSETAEFLGE